MNFLIAFATLLAFLLGLLLYQYYKQTIQIKESYSKNLSIAGADGSESFQLSVFNNTVEYLKAFLFIFGVALAFAWFQVYLGHIWSFVIGTLLLCATIPYKWSVLKTSLFASILLYSILLAIMISALLSKQGFIPLIIPGMLWGAFLGIQFDKTALKLKSKISFQRDLIGLPGLINSLAISIGRNNSFKKGFLNNQALTITIAIIAFLILPDSLQLLPPEIGEGIKKLVGSFDTNKQHISLLVFTVYIVLSIFLLQERLNLFTQSRYSLINSVYSIISSLLVFVFSILLGIVLFLGVSIFLLHGYKLLGEDFAIILGFFVFPIWIEKLIALFMAILILAFDLELKNTKALKTKVNTKQDLTENTEEKHQY